MRPVARASGALRTPEFYDSRVTRTTASGRFSRPGISSRPSPGLPPTVTMPFITVEKFRDQLLVPAGIEGSHAFLDECIACMQREVARRHVDNRSGAIVRSDRNVPRLGHARNLACFRQATAPRQIEHHDVGSASLEILPKCMRVREGFGGAGPGAGVGGIFLQISHVIEAKRVFMPVGVKFSQPLREALGHRQAPQ